MNSPLLAQAILKTAASQREEAAVIEQGQTLSYEDLVGLAGTIQTAMLNVGDVPRRVGVLTDFRCRAAAAFLALLTAGITFVPLNSAWPDPRLKAALAEAEVDAILADQPSLRRAADLHTRVIEGFKSISRRNLDPNRNSDRIQPAYLLFTSGTTYSPKGVIQSQDGALEHALSFTTSVGLNTRNRIAGFAHHATDAGIMDLLGALVSGATWVPLDPLMPSHELWAQLESASPSVLHLTPTVFRHLTNRGEPAGKDLHQLNYVVLGGETALPMDYERFMHHFPPGSQLINGYGPTECTTAFHHLCTERDFQHQSLPIGSPLPHVRYQIENEQDGVGELIILSQNVATGYLPGQDTANRFHRRNGSQAYRTGDLVSRASNGVLVHRGRVDDMIKIAGNQVHPQDVQRTLARHPQVAEAVVLTVTARGVPRLVAFFTASTPMVPEERHLRRYLSRLIPKFGIPYQITAVPSIPLGTSGKVDRSALLSMMDSTKTDAVRLSALETAIVAIWRDVLGVDDIPIDSPFITLGGDSLQELQMLTRIEAEHLVRLSESDLAVSPTVRQLAGAVEKGRTR